MWAQCRRVLISILRSLFLFSLQGMLAIADKNPEWEYLNL